jgi:hypothetical protein
MVIWQEEGWKTLRYTPPASARKWLSFAKIAQELSAKKGVQSADQKQGGETDQTEHGYTANSVSIVVGQIERYQNSRASQWPRIIDVQLDPRKPEGRRPKVVRFKPFSIIAYPSVITQNRPLMIT